MKIAVMVSGGGSNLQALIDAQNAGKLGGMIVKVISSSASAYALKRAASYSIASEVVERGDYANRAEYDEAVLSAMDSSGAELFVLAGYMQILSEKAVSKYRNRIINIHPSLIPSFCGMGYFSAKVHQSVIEYGCKVSGATVHFVDEGADTGPIIMQRTAPVLEDDDAKTLQQKILKLEHDMLPEAVALIASGRVRVIGRRVYVGEDKKAVVKEAIE
ncbi:MAG: phosphoribosylglycinamide formyltransferase [Christensenellales bacterium]|jgi:phosphoribosylglycinamide formyltransferase-1